ncbi:MAG: VanZ family protein [Coriobacteriia bacterium]|nr:VanZ family protein [Coriobacteriia bacterium]
MLKIIKAQPIYVIILAILTVVLIGFIWFNSSESKPVSKEKSAVVTEILRPPIEPIVGKKVYGVNFVRKLAHVAEYSALGFLSALTLLLARTKSRFKFQYKVLASLGLCIVVAAIDETIQVFSGRGPLVTDVLLDFSSAFACALIVSVVWWAVKRKDHTA